MILLLAQAWASPSDISLVLPALMQLGLSISQEGDLPGYTAPDWQVNQSVWVCSTAMEDEQLSRLVDMVRDGGTAILVVDAPTEALKTNLQADFSLVSSPNVSPSLWQGAALETINDTYIGWTLPPGAVSTTVFAETHEDVVVAESFSLGQGTLVLVGVPHLLEDASMLHEANLQFLASLIEQISEERQVYQVYLLDPGGPPADTPFSAMLRAGLGPVLLQSLVVFLLAAWWKGRAFAPPLAPPAVVRRDFTEHIHAAARLYRDARASRKMLQAYATLAMSQLRNRTRAGDESLPRLLAARSQLSEARITRILESVRGAHANSLSSYTQADPSGDLYLQEELWELTSASLKDTPTTSLPALPLSASQSDSEGWKLK